MRKENITEIMAYFLIVVLLIIVSVTGFYLSIKFMPPIKVVIVEGERV